VSKVVVHPLYGEGQEQTGNDIAIIFLSSPAKFGFYVRPACLWDSGFSYSDEGNVSELFNHFTTRQKKLFSTVIMYININFVQQVVGWGKDELGNRVSKAPKLAVLPIVSQEECLRSNRDFYYITSNTTLCAGARDGKFL